MKQVRGFGLAEVLISLFLSSLILTTFIKHFVTSKSQYQTAQNNLNQRYDVQLISDLLSSSIKQAGFTPCLGIKWLAMRDGHHTAIKMTSDNHHALQLSRMSENFSQARQMINTQQLVVEGDNFFKPHQTIMVADCFHAEIETITQVKKQANQLVLSLKNPLHYHYREPIYVGEWLVERFFIALNNRGKPALFYQIHHPEELSDAIQRMNVQLVKQKNKMLVQINLNLKEQKIIHLEIATRAS